MNMFSIFYFSKSTSIQLPVGHFWDDACHKRPHKEIAMAESAKKFGIGLFGRSVESYIQNEGCYICSMVLYITELATYLYH